MHEGSSPRAREAQKPQKESIPWTDHFSPWNCRRHGHIRVKEKVSREEAHLLTYQRISRPKLRHPANNNKWDSLRRPFTTPHREPAINHAFPAQTAMASRSPPHNSSAPIATRPFGNRHDSCQAGDPFKVRSTDRTHLRFRTQLPAVPNAQSPSCPAPAVASRCLRIVPRHRILEIHKAPRVVPCVFRKPRAHARRGPHGRFPMLLAHGRGYPLV